MLSDACATMMNKHRPVGEEKRPKDLLGGGPDEQNGRAMASAQPIERLEAVAVLLCAEDPHETAVAVFVGDLFPQQLPLHT